MAESLEFGRSIDRDSDHVPDVFCEPCYEVNETIKPVTGFCKNCNENLFMKSFNGHLRRNLFQDHTLIDKSTRPKTKSTQLTKSKNVSEECLLHHGETIHSFCHDHDQFCCKVCLTIDHQVCRTDNISKLAKNVQDSQLQELQNLISKLNKLKKGFNDCLSKKDANEIVIQNNYRDAIIEMRKLKGEFDRLMTETEAKAEKVKEGDFGKIEKVAATCNIVIEQINKLTTNLETLKEQGENERLFVSLKRAESQLKSLEGNQAKLDIENVTIEYKFEPDARLITLLGDLQELGQLLYEKPANADIPKQSKTISMPYPSLMPTYLKDITTSPSYSSLFGSLVLPNSQMLVTEWRDKKVKLIDTNRNKTISEIKVSGRPFDIALLEENEFAVTICGYPKSKVQFVSVYQNFISKGKDVSVNGKCRGITYNAKDQTFVIATTSNNNNPGRIQITNKAGCVIKCLDKDSKGDYLFSRPRYVALSRDMTEMYVTDSDKHSVTMMTMNGDIKAVYQDKDIHKPFGICVNHSGLVYVVGQGSHTLHQLDPVLGIFKPLLCHKDGITQPASISFSDMENKIYIGMENDGVLKVFQMK